MKSFYYNLKRHIVSAVLTFVAVTLTAFSGMLLTIVDSGDEISSVVIVSALLGSASAGARAAGKFLLETRVLLDTLEPGQPEKKSNS